MKRKVWINHLLGALFAFILSISTVGCLVTGFDLPVNSMANLVLFCGICSLLCALLYCFRFGGSLLLCLSALVAVIAWRHSALWEQIQTLMLHITTHFHKVYNWPAIGSYTTETVALPLMVLAWWTSSSVSFYVCRRRALVNALLSVILPLAVCLIVTNTVPDELYLYLLILGISLLLVTDWVRRNHPSQSVALTLRMSLPVAAALAALFLLNPRDSYTNNAAELQRKVIDLFQQMQTVTEDVGTITEDIPVLGSERLSLRAVGPKSKHAYSVMRISSPISGTLYLRGQDYDTYTGSGWLSFQGRSETLTPGGNSIGQLTVTTYGVHNVLYVPYYSADKVEFLDGCMENTDNLSRYSYALTLSPSVSPEPNDDQYTQLPSDSRWAETLASKITSGYADRESKVQAIGNYVRNSAVYDLSTSRMPNDQKDFAQWFLEESDTGYCVHFATAATVLLRAAGIPARYVEGYMVSCHAEEQVIVSNQSAHAWVEYYNTDTSAWTVLEVTPPDANAETEPGVEPETEVLTPIESDHSEPAETKVSNPTPSGDTESPTLPAPDKTTPSQQKTSFRLPEWVKVLFWITAGIAAVILQGNLRISRKRRNWNRGNPNEMALNRWQQSRYLAKILNVALPDELDILAQKARFSQHTLTREELQQFEHFRRNTLRTVHSLPLYKKLILRWILAIG